MKKQYKKNTTNVKVGEPFTYAGEEGWTVKEVQQDGIVITRKRPDRWAYLPYGTF